MGIIGFVLVVVGGASYGFLGYHYSKFMMASWIHKTFIPVAWAMIGIGFLLMIADIIHDAMIGNIV